MLRRDALGAGLLCIRPVPRRRTNGYADAWSSSPKGATISLPSRFLQSRFLSPKGRTGPLDEQANASSFQTSGKPTQPYTVVFVSPDEKMQLPCSYRPGQTLLAVAFENGVGVEGACGGRCACSTCHVILTPDAYRKFPDAEVEELDLLEAAPGSQETSRLACQLRLTEAHNCMQAKLPETTKNQIYA